ncbi:MAG: ATP-dependent DNA helicase [Deltaproteobacteria bacterium]|nr:MAG: ATP-dependent DNA helicase [Deltaproteobacteria bacterium]
MAPEGKGLPKISVSVRELVEFVMLSGSLERGGLMLGESMASIALEGTRGHQEIQSSRPDTYEAEVTLKWDVVAQDHILHVRGRVDGIMHEDDAIIIEEIKTHGGYGEISPSSVHWAQGKVYAYIYLQEHPLDSIDVQLTYMHRKTREIHTFRESFTREELNTFFADLVEEYLEWIQRKVDWLLLRTASIDAVDFPYSSYREGQRHLAVAAYRAMADKQVLMAEAPTGIGKTMAVLFPAVKAMGQGHAEKIFFLTAKTVGRTVAEKAFDDMREAGLRFRSLTLTARDKICSRNGEPCEVMECPFAEGYYDRLKDGLRAGLEREDWTLESIREVAYQHDLCPFEFALDLSEWADAIVCDYNYVFDPKVYLRRFFDTKKGKYLFLIDEAHNLVDRARSMYSAELSKRLVLDTKKEIKGLFPKVVKRLNEINRWMIDQRKLVHESAEESPYEQALVESEKPKELLGLLYAFLEDTVQSLTEKPDVAFPETLLDMYFQARDFLRTAELFSSDAYVSYYQTGRFQEQACLYCLDPSKYIRRGVKKARGTVLFSATLRPVEYYRDLLGHPDEHPVLQLPSPFPPENLQVWIDRRIATTYRARASTYDNVVEAIGAMVDDTPTNILVYFPSYKYMNDVWERFVERFPEHVTMLQTPGMSEEARLAFLEAFVDEPKETLIAFAVMGGIFGEGIDLVGERLGSVVIVGVGLPQVCLERNLIRDHFQAKNNAGFLFAYTFPGMNRVLQAVGRLIRTEEDKGKALLIDKRFAYRDYSSLFPPWWDPKFLR